MICGGRFSESGPTRTGFRVEEVTGDIAELRTDVRGLDTRLRAVEVALGKVDQRLETLERLHLPGPER